MSLGDDLRVDAGAIEKSLAELWRGENEESAGAVTRAALWNVVAHTADSMAHAHASETLASASASVPQRTIVIRADPNEPAEIASWISANCHRIGGDKQVCSEEISIVAGGARVAQVPPLVNALLIPDMPVAVWWLGDLPSENEAYVESLLDPADRMIVDSAHFDAPNDLALVRRVGEQTTTAPADLNWVRLEEWRAATASIFDPPRMRERLRNVRSVKVALGTGTTPFGRAAEALLYAAWLSTQAGIESIDYAIGDAETSPAKTPMVEIRFGDGTAATIMRDRERGILVSTVDGASAAVDCITRVLGRGIDDLIVRQLKRPEADRVYLRTLSAAALLAPRIAA